MSIDLLPALTGSFSTPAAGNPTGAMVEAAYEHHGVNARYLNCDVSPDDLADAVRGARAMGWIGFNCSLPHKVAVIDLIDELAPSARLIGAVNCVVRDGDRWRGENTDGQGFLRSLATVADPAGQRAVIIGAGGASRAIAVELSLAGAAHVTIINRNVGRAEAIASLITDHTDVAADASTWTDEIRVPAGTTLLINATSIGLPGSADLPVAFDGAARSLVACDVIPNPPQTPFLQRARAAGATTLDGRGMLVNQAAVNIKLWTGIEPDEAVMGQALESAISGWEHP